MGGIALEVARHGAPLHSSVDAMIRRAPYRASAGVAKWSNETIELAELQTHKVSDGVVALDHFTLVGDVRLIRRQPLRAVVSDPGRAASPDDRTLLLAAFAEHGPDAFDHVDGDYAFAIWDNVRQELTACRDRFGCKPLFYDQTAASVRVASELRQLTDTAPYAAELDDEMIAHFLIDRPYRERRRTFVAQVTRVEPGHYLRVVDSEASQHRYWLPTRHRQLRHSVPVTVVREALAESVEERTANHPAAACQLSGGLDSSTLYGLGRLAVESGTEKTRWLSVSAVYPDFDCDESEWIAANVDGSPIPHHERPMSVLGFDEMMQTIDRAPRPVFDWSAGPWRMSAEVAAANGATVVLTGVGGDELFEEDFLIADLIRQLRWLRAGRGVVALARRNKGGLRPVLREHLRAAAPSRLKRPLRRLLGSPPTRWNALANPGFRQSHDRAASRLPFSHTGLGSITTNTVADYVSYPSLVWALEDVELVGAAAGVEFSHPFLDRTVVEVVVSIPVARRPLDTRSKALLRDVGEGLVPEHVRTRRAKTVFDRFALAHYHALASPLVRSFPTVPEGLDTFIDRASFATLANSIDKAEMTLAEWAANLNVLAFFRWSQSVQDKRALRCR
ncbi:MAG: asparagine synthase-related protein [Acidimicrobiales bacterium]